MALRSELRVIREWEQVFHGCVSLLLLESLSLVFPLLVSES